MLKISIVIPIYQAEEFLEECLRSVAEQTCKKFEVILINDGSTDRSEEICRKYVKKDERFRLISQENKGTVLARLRGVKEARFDKILFVDSDDWIDRNALELLCDYGEHSNADIVVSTLIGEWEKRQRYLVHGVEEGVYKGNCLRNEICPNMIWNTEKHVPGIRSEGCGKLFRKDILLSCMEDIDPKITVGDDFAFVYPYILRSESIVILGKREAFYHYRQRKSGLGKQQGKNLAVTLAPFYEYMEKKWRNDTCLMKQLQFHKLKHCKLSMEREFEISQRTAWKVREKNLEEVCRRWNIESWIDVDDCMKEGFSFLDSFILKACLKHYYNIAGSGIILQKIINKGKR